MDEKLEKQAAQLAAIDQVTLTPLVQSALNSETVEVMDWDYEQVHGGAGAGNAVYRFTGQGRDREQKVSWSLILKTAYPEGDNTHISAWNDYKREAHAYQSGWLADLPGGLVAPRCFRVIEHPDGACWMWIEDIRDMFNSQWPLEHYSVVARHLGRFNGAYMVDRPLPGWSWMSSNWLRRYIEHSAPAIEPLRNALANPWARRWLPEEDSDQFFNLWAERELYLDTLDRLPQTTCHFDVFRRNLFARKTADGDDQTVVIDWAFVGRGPIGADLSPLVTGSIAFNEVGLDKAQELDKIVFDGYLEGLRDTGWQGDRRQARMGHVLADLRHMFFEIGRWLTYLLDESLHASVERAFGRPLGELLDTIAQRRRSLVGQLEEARELIDALA